MVRININNLIKIDNNFVKDGTSALYLAHNSFNNRDGILKENGCMLGVDNEDLREKLSSTILNICNVPCADIDLCIDNTNKHYCLSYNVLKENQEHIELEYSGNIDNTKNSEQLFIDYFDTNVGFPCGISVLGTSPAACGEI